MKFESFLLLLSGAWWQTLLAQVLLLFAARGIGCLLLPRRRDEFIRFALGAAVLALLYPWWWRNAPGWLGGILLLPAARGVWDIPWKTLKDDWRLYLVLGGFGVFTLASAFLPPYVWDEQVYQTLLYARFPETAGKIDNPYSAYPLLPHFFMMWVRSWGGLSLPRLTVWLLSLFLGGKLYLETRRRCKSPVFAAVAAAVVMLSPLALVLHNGFYAESFVALFALAGFLTLENPTEDYGAGSEARRQLLAGVFAGACVAVKLTGVGAALMLAIIASKRRYFRCFAAAAVFAALPFFIRPWLTFGNPVYPFGSALWGSEKAKLVENVFRALGSDYGTGKIVGTATGWLTVCFAGGKVYDGVVCGFGVLALTLLLFFGLWRSRDKSSLVSFGALAAGYFFWAMTSQQSRFLYPLLFVAVLLLADNFHVFEGRNMRLAAILLPAVGAVVSWQMLYPQLKTHVTAWRIIPMARREPGRFLVLTTNDPGYFNALKLLGRVAPAEARVLLLGERRGLYVPRRFEHGSPLFQEARLTPVPKTADELWQGIKDFDYVLLGSGQNRIDHLERYNQVDALLERHLSTLQRRGKVRLVRVPENVECQPVLEVVREP